MKYIISTDGVITDRETTDISKIANAMGFENFQLIFEKVDQTITSLDDLKKLLKKIENKTSRDHIIQYAIEFCRADAACNPHEAEILQYMGKEWHVDIKKILHA
jgi:hypothetical protein